MSLFIIEQLDTEDNTSRVLAIRPDRESAYRRMAELAEIECDGDRSLLDATVDGKIISVADQQFHVYEIKDVKVST